MFIWGRLLGGLVGLFSLGLFGLFIGFFLGLIFDRATGRLIQEGSTGSSEAGQQEVKAAFMQLLFTCLGDLAKADGRVSEEEVAHTEQVMARLNLDATTRAEAIKWFKEGTNPLHEYDHLFSQFSRIARGRADLKKFLIESLISLAMSDGSLNFNEEKTLLKIASKLGFPAFIFSKMLEQLKAQDSFRQQQTSVNSKSQLDDAYKVLGVDASMSDQEIKKCYRKLMSENHPDKLIAKGVPEDVIKLATEKSQAIQSAYELIKSARK